MMKPEIYHINNPQAFLKSRKRHHLRSILDQSISLIICTAIFLKRNTNTVMANNAAIKSSEVKTRNSY